MFRYAFTACRPHQWTKNFLVFVPLLASHRYTDIQNIFDACLCFVIFCLSASGVYLQNDYLDYDEDLKHQSKKNRPLAAGRISKRFSLILSLVLWSIAICGSYFFLPLRFLGILVVYMFSTLSYSFGLKRKPILDVGMLASFYTLRIIAGSEAIQVTTSFWLLTFSMFMFSSLALMKRFTALQAGETAGNAYRREDRNLILNLGLSSGLISVLVLAFYIQDEKSSLMYPRPELIWAACPIVILWISKIWLHAHKGEMHEDPIVFAIKDKGSLFLGALLMTIFILALQGA